MKMIQADNKYRPRRKSKKMKAKERELASLRRQREQERKDDLRNMKTWEPSIGPAFKRNDNADKAQIPSAMHSKTQHDKLKMAQHDKLKMAQHDKRILTTEMAERERLAQAEIERKKKCIAPAYNKGAYQYIATEDQAKDVGR